MMCSSRGAHPRDASITTEAVRLHRLAAEHLENLAASGTAETTMTKNRWMVQVLAAPLSRRPIAQIAPIEVLDVLKRIEKSGGTVPPGFMKSLPASSPLRQPLTHQPRNDVAEAARRKGDDPAQRPRRVGLRPRRPRHSP
jgi:hypothetical protein